MQNEEDDPNDLSQSCRLCGQLIEDGVRKMKKGKLSDVLKRVYDLTVAHDPGHYLTFVHYNCNRKLLYSQQGNGRDVPDLYMFPILTPRCRRCGQRACIDCQGNQAAGERKKLLMDVQTRHFANKRVKPFDDKVNEYCTQTGEDKVDILKYTLQKELFAQGKRKEAGYVGKLSSGLDTPSDPLTAEDHTGAHADLQAQLQPVPG